jgi:LPXTG-motif cell wall-anchored protein
VRILRPGASAAIKVVYLDSIPQSEVLSKNISGDQNLTFLPPQSGAYELRVSIGSDQRTVGFRLQECTLITNVTKNVEIVLQQPSAPPAAPPSAPATLPPSSPSSAAPPAQVPSEIPSWAIVAVGLLILAAAALLFFGKKKAQQ